MERACPANGEASEAGSFNAVESFSRMVTPLATWRVTQGIYRIDPQVAEAVWNTPIDGELPVELLFRLPEWCVYVETPGRKLSIGKRLEGFFAHLNTPTGSDDPELHLLLDDPAGVLHSVTVPLSTSTLEDACRIASIDRANHEQRICWSDGNPSEIARDHDVTTNPSDAASGLAPLISTLLYMCSQSADYRDACGARNAPGKPAPVLTRIGPRLFPPESPTIWETGYRIGAPLRGAVRQASVQQGTNRSSPAPHIRRAHWHSFWLGPKDSTAERRLALKWLPPIAVALSTPEELIPSVRRVG